MIGAIRRTVDQLLGRGEASITVPTLDGALKPNQILEHAEIVAELPHAEDLASDGATLYVADGPSLRRLAGDALTEAWRFDRPITAFCLLASGGLAVALDGKEVRVFDAIAGGDSGRSFTGPDMTAVNALAEGPDGTVLATDGSLEQPYARWAHDLMSRGATGRLLAIDTRSGAVNVRASALGYAFGVVSSNGDALVSESWRHRLVFISPQGAVRPALGELPVYPSRISRAEGGGYWLTAFTGRTQLVEFVLRENAYRRRMMAEIAPEHWIVPRLRSGQSFKEPMQGAHLKTMGVVKPWAPPRSYGLIVRLNAAAQPVYSLHSRVDGENHGVVAAVEAGDSLYAIAKGPGRLLRLPLAKIREELRL
ncbi:MAG: hypothetical protein KGM42_09625 [Hyphomicrobiales bacterium]|nr:hypothetical protein [Hyphomicrobiales bacterium]